MTGIFAQVCEGCRIVGNIVTSCGGYGLDVPFRTNHIEGNVFTGNSDYGLRLSGNDNVYRGNTARGNGGTVCTGTVSGGDFCDEGTNNTSHGDNYLPDQM